MSQDTSRKHFLAKVLGLATVGALAPAAVADLIVPKTAAKPAAKPAAFRLVPQARAVARGDRSA